MSTLMHMLAEGENVALIDTFQMSDFILARIDSLSENELWVCLQAFSKVGDAKTVEALEQKMLVNLDRLQAALVADIFYYYTKERRGSRYLIESLIKRVDSIAEQPDLLLSTTVA